MDYNNWRPSIPKEEPDMDTGDWRTHLTFDSRQMIVKNITDGLMKHLPNSGAEGMNEARKIATRFEDKIFNGAINQTDYLRKIYMKMQIMENKAQNAADSSSSLSLPATNDSLHLNPGHHIDDVHSTPFLPKAEPAVNTGDLKTQLPPDSRQNNANNISVQYMAGPSLFSGEPAMYTSDWRTQLKPDSRVKIVNKIMETLKKHLPFSGPEGLNELRRIAARFEEKILRSANSLTDYLRKISIKMLTMETKASNAAGSSSSSVSIPAAYNSLPLNPEPAVNTGDWRSNLPAESRTKNANNIKETLKKHVPNCGKEGIKELERIAASFEELIFNTAIDQVDYYRKISFKMQVTK